MSSWFSELAIVDMNDRQEEIEKYRQSYKHSNYGMGVARENQARSLLQGLMPFSSYLDVACGRGEMIRYAYELGVSEIMGTEVVDYLLIPGTVVYGEAHDLPFSDSMFNVVSAFDLLEHLTLDDARSTLSGLKRISNETVLLTISNTQSVHLGRELHITRLEYDEWHQLIIDVFWGWKAERPKSSVTFNQPWILTKNI